MAGLDGQQRARTEQLGVPGFQGTQAGFGPLDTLPPQYSRASPQRGNHLPAKASQHPKSGLKPFRFWLT